MSLADSGAMVRELARVLTTALGRAIAPQATPTAVRAARDAAQVLGLRSLERLLAALEPHAHPRSQPEIGPVLDRLRSLAAECATAGNLEALRGAEAELLALAEGIEALEGGRSSGEGGTIATLSLAEVLEDLPLVDDASRERARRVRVAAPMAAALRAALDWLEDETTAPRPLRITSEESVVEVICAHVNVAGLKPAEKVLSVVGGILAPAAASGSAAHPAGSWMVRVPSFAGRNSHLMLHQGALGLALPWHSILRLYMVPAAEAESGIGGLGFPVLEPLVPLSRSHPEYPVVLVGHGMKRAYLIADRLIWRLEAEPCDPPEAPPAPGLSRAVMTAEGETYWVLDPGPLLARVEAPAAPDSRPRRPAEPKLPVLSRQDVEPLPIPDRSGGSLAGEAPRGSGTGAAPLPLVQRRPQVLEPQRPGPEAPEPGAEKAVAEVAAEPEGRGPRPSGPPRALVAEDSITARVFLTRMLERRGFVVRAVSTSTELFDELEDETWSLICVDVELPDARDEVVLRRVVARLGERSSRSPVVALVRDAADAAGAREVEVTHTLLKPFEREALENLLSSLGFGARTSP